MGEKILGGFYGASNRILCSFNARASFNQHHVLISTKEKLFLKNYSIAHGLAIFLLAVGQF